MQSAGAIKKGSSTALFFGSSWLHKASQTEVVAHVAIYSFSRVYSISLLTIVFIVASSLDFNFLSFRADPSIFTFLGSWDSSAYKSIAINGYPSLLPIDHHGLVQPNEWAFLPVYPYLVKVISAALGTGFYSTGAWVSTFFGALATVVLGRISSRFLGVVESRRAVLLFAFFPISFILNTSYAESLFLFLMFLGVYFLLRRNYLAMLPVGVLASFTRPGALALALTLGIHVVRRWRDPTWAGPNSKWVAILVGGVLAMSGLAWSWVATATTHVPSAYVKTETSWWSGFVGHVSFLPLTPWFVMASRYLGAFGVILVLLLMGTVAWWIVLQSKRRRDRDIVSYIGSYSLYLFAVFLPQQSLLRMLLPLGPAVAMSPVVRSAKRTRFVFITFVVLQISAVILLWYLGYP